MTCSSNQLTLIFSGTLLSDHVHSVKSNYGRLTQIERRPNFWSTSITLDGSYPDLEYSHTFTLYNEEADRFAFMSYFYDLSTKITSRAQNLLLKDGDTTVVDFRSCYMEAPGLKEPDELLLMQAGLLEITFFSTQIPSVVTS